MSSLLMNVTCRYGDIESWKAVCFYWFWSIKRNVYIKVGTHVALISNFSYFCIIYWNDMWFVVTSLLPDRKLRTLFQQPLNHLPESKDGNSLLLLWYWEECLKQRCVFEVWTCDWLLNQMSFRNCFRKQSHRHWH